MKMLELFIQALMYFSGSAILFIILATCWDALAQRWQDWQDNRQFDKLKGKK